MRRTCLSGDERIGDQDSLASSESYAQFALRDKGDVVPLSFDLIVGQSVGQEDGCLSCFSRSESE